MKMIVGQVVHLARRTSSPKQVRQTWATNGLKISCNHNGLALGLDWYWMKIFKYKTYEKLQL